jgi:hemerythrin-like domain-containing protein
MTETAVPIGLAADMIRVHRALTRGLNVSLDAARRFAEFGFDDDDLKAGFLDYLRALVTMLDAHHHGEELLAFPLLRSRSVEGPYDELSAEHHQMEPWIDKTRWMISDVSVGSSLGQSLDALCFAIKEIREIWRPHILKEEQAFNAERIAAQMSPSEQADIGAQLARFSLERAQPSSLVVPFMLYNLPSSDRLVMMSLMPPHVTQD